MENRNYYPLIFNGSSGLEVASIHHNGKYSVIITGVQYDLAQQLVEAYNEKYGPKESFNEHLHGSQLGEMMTEGLKREIDPTLGVIKVTLKGQIEWLNSLKPYFQNGIGPGAIEGILKNLNAINRSNESPAHYGEFDIEKVLSDLIDECKSNVSMTGYSDKLVAAEKALSDFRLFKQKVEEERNQSQESGRYEFNQDVLRQREKELQSYKLMRITAPPGTVVMVTEISANNGSDYDRKIVKNDLKIGVPYTVERTVIDRWRTDVYLTGFSNPFNTVNFVECKMPLIPWPTDPMAVITDADLIKAALQEGSITVAQSVQLFEVRDKDGFKNLFIQMQYENAV